MRKLLSKIAANLVTAGILAFGGITLWNWYHPPKNGVAYRVTQTVPYDATEARLSRKLDRVLVTLPVSAIAPLTPKQAKKVEDKLDGELPDKPGAVLLEFEKIKPLPHGGTGLIYLEPTPDGSNRAKLRIYPSKPPLFEFTPERKIGVWYGRGFGQLGGTVWNVEFEQSLFRLGPVQLSARAGILSSPLATEGYIFVGGKVAF